MDSSGHHLVGSLSSCRPCPYRTRAAGPSSRAGAASTAGRVLCRTSSSGGNCSRQGLEAFGLGLLARQLVSLHFIFTSRASFYARQRRPARAAGAQSRLYGRPARDSRDAQCRPNSNGHLDGPACVGGGSRESPSWRWPSRAGQSERRRLGPLKRRRSRSSQSCAPRGDFGRRNNEK
jgi:hypothetical protein